MAQAAEILKPCPCGSGRNFEGCCQPLILGLEKADTAEALMRSRYAAFVSGDVPYLIESHHPKTRGDLDKTALEEWSQGSEWQGLEIVSTEAGGPGDDEGLVEFVAKYSQGGTTHSHQELSLFKKEDGRWYFYDVKKHRPIKNDNKVGRNDPCICGSGKKFKKCCGK